MVILELETIVQPGGLIHIQSEKLIPGMQVMVIVQIIEPVNQSFSTVRSPPSAAADPKKSSAEIDASSGAARESE
jgi:hypothetical protein